MACENPIQIVNPRYNDKPIKWIKWYSEKYLKEPFPPDFYLLVPCGKCLSCQKRRSRDYKIRLLYELHKYPHSIFFTLTFDDEHLEEFKDCPNKAVRLFLDRLRKNFEIFDNKVPRHWIAAEYGEKRGRLHYHGFFFLDKVIDFEPSDLAACWSYGRIDMSVIRDVNKSAAYVSKYVTKYVNGDKPPPRVISSKGIGDGYFSADNIHFHKDGSVYKPYILYGDYKVPLPRFYYDKLFDVVEKERILKQLKDVPNRPQYVNGIPHSNPRDYSSARSSFFKSNKNLGLSFDRPSDNFREVYDSAFPKNEIMKLWQL